MIKRLYPSVVVGKASRQETYMGFEGFRAPKSPKFVDLAFGWVSHEFIHVEATEALKFLPRVGQELRATTENRGPGATSASITKRTTQLFPL